MEQSLPLGSMVVPVHLLVTMCMFHDGGHDGSACQGSLHQLDTRTWTWKQLSSTGPMRKVGCRMVAYGNNLVLFGGYGIPSSPTQPAAEFVKSSKYTNDIGWTNEQHTFDLIKGEGDVVASSARANI